MSGSIAQAVVITYTTAKALSSLFAIRAITACLMAGGFFLLSSRTHRYHTSLQHKAPLPHLLSRLGRKRRVRRRPEGPADSQVDSLVELRPRLEVSTPAPIVALQMNAEAAATAPGASGAQSETRQRRAVPGDKIIGQESWMVKVTILLTTTFLLKAVLQTLATANRQHAGELGADAFPGILVRAPGYDVCFHVPYLMTLFLWHGVSSGNLVALDIARSLSISLLISSSLRVLLLVYFWFSLGLMSTAWKITLGVSEVMCTAAAGLTLQGATRCVHLMQFCSSDPLRTW
eukprot:CAMPEP_0170196194 /NCGR_PEP_ID=MMETSP0040_2-20121228/63264_1 /TAXON_ID=641309 /ORGANISM="Lotharella oceanica, Strain CCMP622" /LENGTH=288 /DNA_ID=CAMNT_0010445535 /DNA_START=58 /DNA_END=921 /DNA_ORIENTATION=-